MADESINLIDKIIFLLKYLKTFYNYYNSEIVYTIKTAIWAVDSRIINIFIGVRSSSKD